MALKILLVYPEIPPTYWNMQYALHFIGKRATLPPLGLITVAAMLPDDCELTLVDMNVTELTRQAVAQADLVFTSSMLIQRASHQRVVALCNDVGTPVVAGGPFPTSSHAEMKGVDYFVLGEAEDLLSRFIDDFKSSYAAHVYTSPTRPEIAKTPVPRFDLLDASAYSSMALQFSRGCPHTCEFCDVIELFGRTPRVKSTPQFMAEVEALYASGFRGSLFVVDDNFIGNKKSVFALLPELADWQQRHGYPFALYTEATVTLASDDALVDAMTKAGFNMVFLGIETPVEASLRDAHKLQNLKLDLLASVRRLQERGLEVSAGFIVGFDSDPDDVFERQLRFIEAAGIPMAMVGMLTALPRTRLHKRLAAEGRMLEAGDGNNTHELRLTFVPKMDPQVLVGGYARLLHDLYSPARYFARCVTLLRHLKPHRTSTRRVGRTELRALVMSLVLQTLSGYGWQYWKFLGRALFASPKLFAEAITMAVKGHHYFKMTARVLAQPFVLPKQAPALAVGSNDETALIPQAVVG